MTTPSEIAKAHVESHHIGWKASGKTGIVAAGGVEAVAAGTGILEQGGNAMDAAVATIFALNVTDHGLCSIGGEVPLIFFNAATKKVKVLCGQGRAPLSQAAIDWYMKHGIPHRNDIKIAPVPSVVDLCATALASFGTKSLAETLAPSIELLDAGKASWSPKLAKTMRRLCEEEGLCSGDRQQMIQAACDRFYGRNPLRNDIAEDLEAYYLEKGGFLRREDLANHRTTIEDPVCVDYRGYTVCKCGPWTQGPFLCQALRLLEGFDLKAMGHLSADFVHIVTEAIKLAMADRDEYYGDPDFVPVPLKALLSEKYNAIRRPLIDLRRASMEARPGDPEKLLALKGPGLFRPGVGGTTTLVVADRWGNVVAATPSANVEDFDGGPAGVTYSNRLCSLNTTPGHPNCIQPGKRPRITLTPTLVLKDNRPILAISVAGGDLQDQATLGLLLGFIDFGLMPEEAVTAPRFGTGHHQDSFNPDSDREKTFVSTGSLLISDSVRRSVLEELEKRGHKLSLRPTPLAMPVMLHIDPRSSLLSAAGDPAAGRHAAALD